MPIIRPFTVSSRAPSFRRGAWSVLTALFLATGFGLHAAEPKVAVLYGAKWSPGDAARDGAAEFEVLMCAANVRQGNAPGGIVGVGPRHGAFCPSAEMVLERVAHMGVAVVRLAAAEPMPAHDGDAFVEAGTLSPAEAKRVLTECLARYGAPPAAADPAHPTKQEQAAIEAKIALYQFQFDAQSAVRVAAR